MSFDIGEVFLWFIGLSFSVVGGHLLVFYIVGRMRAYIQVETDSQKLTAALGMIERFIYSLMYALGHYQIIYFWFGLRIVQKLIRYKADTMEEVIKQGERINVYFIGNIVSLASAILAVEMVKWFLLFRHPASFPAVISLSFNSRFFSVLSILSTGVGTVFLARGFWPPIHKFSVTKRWTSEPGKPVQETPLLDTTDLAPESELPKEILEGKVAWNEVDKILYRKLIKSSKDTIKTKWNGCLGSGFLLFGAVLALIALYL